MDWHPGESLRVETERFVLRSLTPADASPDYVSWWNDPQVQEGLNMPPRGWNQRRAMQHIANFDNRTKFHLGIFCKDERKLIGFFAMFISPDVKVALTNVVIGDKAYWGKRVVQEVRGRMLPILFEEMGVEKVKGEVTGRNFPSIFNYKAQGFRCEGILREEKLHFDSGTRVDVYVFGLLRDEWRARQAAMISDGH